MQATEKGLKKFLVKSQKLVKDSVGGLFAISQDGGKDKIAFTPEQFKSLIKAAKKVLAAGMPKLKMGKSKWKELPPVGAGAKKVIPTGSRSSKWTRQK